MSTSTLELFNQPTPEPQGERVAPTQALPTVTSTGQPTEWGFSAIEAVFASRKDRVKKLDPTARAELTKALWIYAFARHEALLARRSAGAAAPALLGHRNAKDELGQALCLLDRYGITPADIPPAVAYAPVDLRSIAGESPFPLPPDEPGRA